MLDLVVVHVFVQQRDCVRRPANFAMHYTVPGNQRTEGQDSTAVVPELAEYDAHHPDRLVVDIQAHTESQLDSGPQNWLEGLLALVAPDSQCWPDYWQLEPAHQRNDWRVEGYLKDYWLPVEGRREDLDLVVEVLVQVQVVEDYWHEGWEGCSHPARSGD